MNDEQALKMTDLDYKTAVPHLQMIKAALPYVNGSEQRLFSLFVKVSELQHTMQLFDDAEEGVVGICSLEADAPSSPLDMLNAMKPFGSESEQEFIDLIINFLESSKIFQNYRDSFDPDADLTLHRQQESDVVRSQSGNSGKERQAQRPNENKRRNDTRRFPIDQFKNILPPEQQSRFETAQMIMQTLQQFS